MTRTWDNPDRDPTPAELAAWADGELDEGTAAHVESWLADHPDALADTLAQGEADRRLVALFRAHPPADPSPTAWHDTRRRLDAALAAPRRPRWPGFLLGILSAAAVLGALAAASLLLPALKHRPVEDSRAGVVLDPADNNDEPFAVAVASEVQIISMDARDADRVLVGQPLLDSIDFATPEDIELVNLEDEPEDGRWPTALQRGSRMPMVIVRADRTDDEP